ncbi:MAG TPA: MrpF/PhaF family protein [Burkholderiaceae bacterium]|nr:MrpF/PhaF family protein [Burkholderiaceae bacterium]
MIASAPMPAAMAAAWLIAALGLIAALIACGFAMLRGRATDRLVALQLATTLAIQVPLLLGIAWREPSFGDIALVLALLSFAGTVVFAHFLERWL